MLQEDSMKSLCADKFSDLFSVLYTTLACYIDAEPPAYTPPTVKSQERFGFIPNREAIKLSPAKITVQTFNAFLEQADCQKVSVNIKYTSNYPFHILNLPVIIFSWPSTVSHKY